MKKAIQIKYDDLFETKCLFASEAGFEHIAVNFSEFVGKSEDECKKMTYDIQRILSENKLECVQTHTCYYDLRLSSEIIDENYERAIEQAVIASADLGADWCVIHPRSSVKGGFITSKSMEDNQKYFSGYLELAHKSGTGIAAENLPIFHDIVPVMSFFSSNYEDLCNFVDSFNDEKMKICWDFGHANLMHFDQADAIRFLGERIKCTHIHNNFGRNDDHMTPEIGDIPWEKVMGAMYDIKYSGPLTLETHCWYDNLNLLKSFARHNYVCLEFLEQYIK